MIEKRKRGQCQCQMTPTVKWTARILCKHSIFRIYMTKDAV